MIDNRLCYDNKLSVLPVSHRWMFLGLLLECGSHSSDTVVMSERQLRVLLESSKSVVRALDALQSLHILSYTIEPSSTSLIIEEKLIEEKRSKEKRREVAQAPGSDDPPPASDQINFVLSSWNKWSGKLPKAKGLNSTRKKHTAVLLREHPDEAYWTEVVQKIQASNFCNGKNDRGWIATFDWFIRGDTHLKVLEGKYDNRTTVQSTAQTRKYDKLDELEKEWQQKAGET